VTLQAYAVNGHGANRHLQELDRELEVRRHEWALTKICQTRTNAKHIRSRVVTLRDEVVSICAALDVDGNPALAEVEALAGWFLDLVDEFLGEPHT
jgi:hypothetical protein